MRLPRQIIPYGNSALLLRWENVPSPEIEQGVLAYAEATAGHPAITDKIIAPTSLLLLFDANQVKRYALQEWVYDLQPVARKRKPPADLRTHKSEAKADKDPGSEPPTKRLITVECIDPGQATYLVDGGRAGLLQHGLPLSGAADRRAAGRARELLQLPPNAVVMEFSGSGGQWLVSGKGQLVLTGADLGWRLNGRPAEAYTTIDFDGDFILDGTTSERGQRAYLAIRGKWQVPTVHKSVSPLTNLVGPLRAGWSVRITRKAEIDYSSDLDTYQHCPESPLRLRVSPGPDYGQLSQAQRTQLLNTSFRVTETTREQLRLQPDQPHDAWSTLGIPLSVAAPNLPATLVWTPDGPVLTGRDAPVTSLHQRLLVLTATDGLDQAAQLRPGEALSFFL